MNLNFSLTLTLERENYMLVFFPELTRNGHECLERWKRREQQGF